ncbi:phosphonate metabolism protein PhnM [Arthrobacter alpinus]|uniref:Phosphonate metabolism protein PhnM n=1 Tax=Arthrobacter alpinus TaxID=656366 RepID=A0A0S2M3I9_9MICC|nr:alpha-D-ribose 1-methylphosphonate 5-triphosphate diphosphatase [Arthrobacter alpinus]ALO68080.1 phosphonate metabolism protein PhnM [Arthrobacter alpinus]
MSLILHNARIVLENEVLHGSVRIENGLIEEISPDPHLSLDGVPGEDMGADYLLPGLVELHTDQVESHYQPRPKRFWDPIQAVIAHDAQMAASGMTTVLDAMRIGSGPGENLISGNARTLVNAVISAAEAGLLRADHYVHLRCEVATSDVVDVFDEVGGHERVRMVSLMDHTPGQRQYADIESFRTYMVGKHNMTELQFGDHVSEMRLLSAKFSDSNRRKMAGRAHERGITIAAHDDATQAHIDESTADGVRISEFPTTILAAHAARAAGQLIVMGAPNIVRGGSHSGNVAAAELLRLGLLDILSSDYVPSSPLHAVFLLFSSGDITLPQGAALVSGNPARAAGLDDRGVIAPGKRADVVRVQTYEGAPTEQYPLGSSLPIVRGVWREGKRVA